MGELNKKDNARYERLLWRAEVEVLQSAQVICTTAIGAGSMKLDRLKFACVLFDEATQATEPEALIPIVRGSRHVVMVGDHRQLGPVVLNRRGAKAGYGRSLFERLIALGTRPLRLQVQYRMHPVLSAFPSSVFYEGALQDGITSALRTRKTLDFPWPSGPEKPHLFLAVLGAEELSPSGTSFLNRAEAVSVERVVSRLLRAGILPSQIGVVTPYTGQRTFIINHLQTSGSLSNPELYTEVEVASVDAFQGREKDYIVLSCVRSNDTQSIGFLSDARRLNVALTRAKYGLVIIGNPRALSRNPLWHHLLMHYREHGILVEGPLNALRPCIVQLSRPKPVIPSRSRPLHHLLPTPPASSSTSHGVSKSLVCDGQDGDDDLVSVDGSLAAISLTGFSQASFK
jgi:regulator of nonsense transcripts 1